MERASQALLTLWRGESVISGALACAVVLCGCQRAADRAGERERSALGTGDATASASVPTTSPRSAAGNAEPKSLLEVQLGTVQLQLQGCILTYYSPHSKGHFDVAFPGTCAFADNSKGAVQVVTTPLGPVVLVEASHTVPPTRPNEQSCETRIRGVLIRGDSVFVSKDVQRVASCASGPWDEVMARVFALHAVPVESALAESATIVPKWE